MKTKTTHIQFNVNKVNLQFYKDLMTTLDWATIHANDDMLGVGDSNGVSLWFVAGAKDVANDYDGPGMNHFSFGTSTQAEVDEVGKQLVARGVNMLFETPRHRPDFAMSAEETYYQIMFESPDRILWEVVYTGPKSA